MKIRLIDVPMDFGASRRGVGMGPAALRQAGIKERLVSLGHQVEEETRSIRVPISEHAAEGDKLIRFLEPIVESCQSLAALVEQAMEAESFPLVMGGDHSIAVGTLAGLGSYYRQTKTTWGTLWIDAHGDFNTRETSPSGNIHGMSLAASVGLGHPALTSVHGNFRKLDPANVVLVGLRDVDPGERQSLKDQGVKIFTMADVDRLGMGCVAEQALNYLKARVTALHVSLDVDCLDPQSAPGVGTPVPGGLTYRELHLLMEMLAESGLTASAEVVEINPVLDVRNQTAVTAAEMIGSLLGSTIL